MSTDRNAKAEAASHLATLVLTCVHWLNAPGIATAGKLLLGSFDGKPCCLRRLEQTNGPLCDAKRLEGGPLTPFGSPLLVWDARAALASLRRQPPHAWTCAERDYRIYMYLDNPASDWTALDNHPNPLLVRLAGPERD